MHYKELESMVEKYPSACIYGAGLIGQTWGYDSLKAAGFNIKCFIDRNSKSEVVDNIEVITPSRINELDKNCVVFIAVRNMWQRSNIMKLLAQSGIKKCILMGVDFLQNLYMSLEKSDKENQEKYRDIYNDGEFLKHRFAYVMGKELRLKNPVTYNEKLQWLKVNDHNELYTSLVDKVKVKDIVQTKIGQEYIIPTLGVYDSFNDISIEDLPKSFVMKCNHDSGSVIVCNDVFPYDEEFSRYLFERAMSYNYFIESREWPYKNVRPQILVETNIAIKDYEVIDYKFFCFDGEIDNIMVVRGRSNGKPKYYHFDKNWKLLRYNRLGRSLPDDYKEEKPSFIDNMIEIVELLCKGFPHVRIDMYEMAGKIYFGEYTFYSCGGYETGFDEKTDMHMGGLIKLF